MSAPTPPHTKDLRNFGLLMGAPIVLIFGLAVPWFAAAAFPVWPWLLAGIFAAAALITPRLLRPVYRGWMQFAHLMNWLVSRTALLVIYYAIVLPTALVMRLCGKDPMHRSFNEAGTTYRVPSAPLDRKHLERPF